MHYPHELWIREQKEGSHGEDDVFSPGGAGRNAYDGCADVQDGPFGVERDTDGRPTVTADAVAFLENEDQLPRIELGMFAWVRWEDGETTEAVVVGTRRLDGKVFLDWRKR